MGKPYTCPVCNGYGTVSKPPFVAGDVISWVASGTGVYPCPTCNGMGIVWEGGGING